MRKIAIGIITATILFSGCATTTTSNQTSGVNPSTGQKFTVDNSLPEWVGNPSVGLENAIAATGQAAYSKYGDQVMVPQAELSAKAKLAGMIEEKIYQFQKNAAKRAQVDIDESFASEFKDVSKRVVKGISLSGVRSINRYQSPVTGTLYIRVMIPTSQLADEIKESQEQLKEKYKKMGLTQETAEKMLKGVEEEAEREWGR